MTARIAICGAGGRMGAAIHRLALANKNVTVSALVERPDSPLIGTSRDGVPFTGRLEDAFAVSDIVVDFTTTEAAIANAAVVARAGKSLVAGTTGIVGDLRDRFVRSVQGIPVVFSPNMSLSANVLFDATERLAKLLPDYDAEVVEIHHNKKKDSPSGTAQRFAEAVARGRGQSGPFVYGRHGIVGERKTGEIAVHAVRGGDVIGDHTVLLLGQGERVEIIHRVTTRDAFANGAVVAAAWLAGKPAGLYDMRDVLGLK